MTSLLEARGIAIAGRLNPTSVDAAPGSLIALIGPNGAGKTSLLRTLAGIEREMGQILVDGEPINEAPPARRMRLLSFLPATRSLVWPIAAQDVIALGLPSRDPARIVELVELLELGNLAARPVNQLSTGERSRVLLARALAARPRLMLLDEPLSNLDPYWVLRTLQILRAEIDASGCTVLASVHDLSQITAFDRALLVDRGGIIADGSPAVVLESHELSSAFRIERAGTAWRISEKT
jgi:iron complex transport system ATP-binding protein